MNQKIQTNTIHNEDCMIGMGRIPDHSIDLVLMDPPYQLSSTSGGGAFGSNNRGYHNQLTPMASGFSSSVLDECCRVLKKPNLYVFCSKEQLWMLLNYAVSHSLNYEVLTWHKTNPTPTCSNKYLSDTEFIFFMRGKGVKVYGSYASKHKYFVTPVNAQDKLLYGHPCCKPVPILETLIGNSSLPGEIVLDPFMGSGSTAVAAQNLGRQFVGFEIDETYYKSACTRIYSKKQ